MKITIQIKLFISRHLTPPRIFILSFLGTILIGALLFLAPFSTTRGSLSFIDALFTSTSAVCVTGLVVIDLGRDLSLWGQIISLILFQLGGLGIVTFSTVFFVLMGRSIPLKEREIVQSTFLHSPRKDLMVILKSILILTFFYEALGTLFLFIRFSQDFPFSKAFFYALYHAISAFNNCGYSLFPDSLIQYQGDWIVNLTVMGLLILGGIGFIVQYEWVAKFKGVQGRLSLHTKMVLITTLLLILFGAFLFYLFEEENVLKQIPTQNKILASLFQSATPRTCGFNTVEIGTLTNATILLMLVLMFIGASPGSTGGGVKTTSAALLVLMIWNRLKGNEEVNLFNRTIPRENVSRTLSIIFASAFSICIVTSFLLITGGNSLAPVEARHVFVEYLFETVSAFGTVGLSMGVTSTLSDIQKLAIILMMFVGRVGPLTFAFSLSKATGKRGVVYAEEGIMVG
jgi:trk system potassium uptake protein TrkH